MGQTVYMGETRQASRQRTTDAIMVAARAQLAEVGAEALSLRSVAREVGMVSSAVYRYVESRDDLLTRLIIEAYDALGEVAERAAADAAGSSDLDRWVSTGAAIRSWSIDHPHDHFLLYGTPVPGYAAPQDTVAAGTRVTLALAGIVRDAAGAGRLDLDADLVLDGHAGAEVPPLRSELATLLATISVDAPVEVALAFISAWSQMFGLIAFELTNQTRGVVEHHEALFLATVRSTARRIGLR